MKQSSTNLLLFGVALLLFGIAFPTTVGRLVFTYLPMHSGLLVSNLILSAFPVAGLIFAFIGLFARNRE